MRCDDNKRHGALLSKMAVCVKGVDQVDALDVGFVCTLKRMSSLIERLIGSEEMLLRFLP